MKDLWLQYDYSEPEWYEFLENLPSDVRAIRVWDINRYICCHKQSADTSVIKCDVCGELSAGKKIYIHKSWRIETRDGGEATFCDDYPDEIVRMSSSYLMNVFCVHRNRDWDNPDKCSWCGTHISWEWEDDKWTN